MCGITSWTEYLYVYDICFNETLFLSCNADYVLYHWYFSATSGHWNFARVIILCCSWWPNLFARRLTLFARWLNICCVSKQWHLWRVPHQMWRVGWDVIVRFFIYTSTCLSDQSISLLNTVSLPTNYASHVELRLEQKSMTVSVQLDCLLRLLPDQSMLWNNIPHHRTLITLVSLFLPSTLFWNLHLEMAMYDLHACLPFLLVYIVSFAFTESYICSIEREIQELPEDDPFWFCSTWWTTQ